MILSIPKRHKGKKLYVELWKDIIDYEGLYQISNLGRVKSLNYKRTGKEHILKFKKDRYGYLYVYLSKNGKKKIFYIHRLVAMAFIPNPDNKPYVDHINTIKTKNEVTNLRWVTPKENNDNPLTKQHNSKANKGKKLSEETKKKISENSSVKRKVYCIELDKVFNSITEVSKELGISTGHISAVCKGKYKHAKGYHFRYYIEEEVA